MGIGVSILLAAGRGVAPMDVLNSGFAKKFEMQVGTASWIITAVCVALAMALGTRPKFGTLGVTLTIGLVINWTLDLLPSPTNPLLAAVQAFCGVLLLWFGALFTIASDFGPGGVDLAMLALHQRGVPLRVARWSLEGTMFIIGVFLGGQVGWMSAVIVLATAPFVAFFLPRVRSLVAA